MGRSLNQLRPRIGAPDFGAGLVLCAAFLFRLASVLVLSFTRATGEDVVALGKSEISIGEIPSDPFWLSYTVHSGTHDRREH